LEGLDLGADVLRGLEAAFTDTVEADGMARDLGEAKGEEEVSSTQLLYNN
jgi:hypothetical protein